MNRDDIQLISQHSNLNKNQVSSLLKNNVYNNENSWHNFLKLFSATIGLCFVTIGIIFFFAYNWDDLHKFAKLGIIEFLVIAAIFSTFYFKFSANVKDILLLCASLLVGVLFAVFGQIYQTGANAYDFFFGWTLAIALWSIFSNFAPLWLIFIVLINTTIFLYSEQIAFQWTSYGIALILLVINSIFLFCFHILAKKISNLNVPGWFITLLGLAVICISTIAIVLGIVDKFDYLLVILTVTSVCLYATGIWYGLRHKKIFYLAAIPFSIIIIFSSLLFKISSGAMMFMVVCLFILGSVTMVIKKLIEIQNKA